MAQLPQRAEINIASIPIRGFGGMCMVIVSLVAAATIPATRWFMLAAIVSGVVFGIGLILLRRQGAAVWPRDGRPLLGERAVVSRRESRRERTHTTPLRAAGSRA